MNIRISRFLLLTVDSFTSTGQPIFRQYVVRVTDHAFVACHDVFHETRIGQGDANSILYQNVPLMTHSIPVVDLDPANPQSAADFFGVQSFYKSLFAYKGIEGIRVLKTPTQVTDQASLALFCTDVSGISARLVIFGAGESQIFELGVQQIGYVAEVTDAVSGRTTTLSQVWPAWETVSDIWHCFSDNAEDNYNAAESLFTFVNHSDSRELNIFGSLQSCEPTSEPPSPSTECCEDVQAMIDPVLRDKTIHPSIRSAIAAGVIKNTTGNSVPAVAHLGAKLMSAVFNAADPDGKQGTIRDNHGIEI